ncbi:MAG: hypothetical protein WKF84_28135 [Pyrinomonadaceae bacterium]
MVCITASDAVRYRTATRKNLLQLEPAQQKEKLRSIYTGQHCAPSPRAVEFCSEWNIRLYRLTSQLFPFSDDPVGEEPARRAFPQIYDAPASALAEAAFVWCCTLTGLLCLDFSSPQVIENSVKILLNHARASWICWRGRARPGPVMNIHGGKGRACGAIGELDRAICAPQVFSRLALENDEYSYGADEILEICQGRRASLWFLTRTII